MKTLGEHILVRICENQIGIRGSLTEKDLCRYIATERDCMVSKVIARSSLGDHAFDVLS